MSKVSFEVTQEMIDESVCGNTRECVIANGIDTLLKPNYFVTVHPSVISNFGTFCIGSRDSNNWYTGALPENANDYANKFDKGKNYVHPARFEFEIPDEYLK